MTRGMPQKHPDQRPQGSWGSRCLEGCLAEEAQLPRAGVLPSWPHGPWTQDVVRWGWCLGSHSGQGDRGPAQSSRHSVSKADILRHFPHCSQCGPFLGTIPQVVTTTEFDLGMEDEHSSLQCFPLERGYRNPYSAYVLGLGGEQTGEFAKPGQLAAVEGSLTADR